MRSFIAVHLRNAPLHLSHLVHVLLSFFQWIVHTKIFLVYLHWPWQRLLPHFLPKHSLALKDALDEIIRGSLLYIDLTSSAPIHPGIYEVHAKVRCLLMNRTSFDSSPHRSFCISRLYTLKVPFTPISLSPCSEIFFLWDTPFKTLLGLIHNTDQIRAFPAHDIATNPREQPCPRINAARCQNRCDKRQLSCHRVAR